MPVRIQWHSKNYPVADRISSAKDSGFKTLPISDLNCWGFRTAVTGAVGISIHALFPFSYGEIARVFFKVAAVRVLASLPLLATLGAFGAWRFGENAGWGARMGCNLAVLCLSLNPVLVTLAFSSQTSDYNMSKLRGGVFIPPFFVGVFLVVILTLLQLCFIFLPPDNLERLPNLIPVIAVFSYALYRWHRFAYDRCWFDTLKIAR